MLNLGFLDELGSALDAAAIPEKALGMAAYMKSATPFLGVPSPEVRKVVREMTVRHPFGSVAELNATATVLWDEAQYREERYAAIMLCDSRLGKGSPQLLAFYTHVISTGQWWDYVDAVAPRIWELLKLHRESMDPLLRKWSTHQNFWFRRSAIISQLPAKELCDSALLEAVIKPNFGDKEFFIRKAIGWALRQHAKSDPVWVLDFVETHKDHLSALSYREAMKHLAKN